MLVVLDPLLVPRLRESRRGTLLHKGPKIRSVILHETMSSDSLTKSVEKVERGIIIFTVIQVVTEFLILRVEAGTEGLRNSKGLVT